MHKGTHSTILSGRAVLRQWKQRLKNLVGHNCQERIETPLFITKEVHRLSLCLPMAARCKLLWLVSDPRENNLCQATQGVRRYTGIPIERMGIYTHPWAAFSRQFSGRTSIHVIS